MRPRFDWRLRTRSLALGGRTLVMGVVNATPDSFSDGGLFADPARATDHALRLLDEGADLLDLGGESTRPGKGRPVTADEECARVLPVVEGVLRACPGAVLSIDTYKAATARRAVEAGCEIVNDVSGFLWDRAMAATCAELRCGVVLMHVRGRRDEWRTLPPLAPEAVAPLVRRELAERAVAALEAGVERGRIVLDPGFGFGKSFDENYPLLAHLDDLHALGFPLLAGTSRKSFVARTLARGGDHHAVPMHERLYGTLATVAAAVLKGAHIVRVHDAKPALDTVRVADAILAADRA